MEFQELADFIELEHQRLNERYGIDDEKMILARAVKLSEEVGELAEQVLSRSSLQRQDKLSVHTPTDLQDEFADVIFTCMLLARSMDVDVTQALSRKMDKINQRWLK